MSATRIKYVDSHTGGEPTRVITGGFPELEGTSLSERLECFKTKYDHLRRGIINEPRGFPAIVGALLCAPDDDASDTAVIFFNNTGYLGMCGHGTIGTVRTLRHLKILDRREIRIETVAGIVNATIEDDGSVSVMNVPSYRFKKDVPVKVPGSGTVVGDIAWGGNWFFIAEEHGREISMSNLGSLHSYTSKIMRSLADLSITGKDGAVIDHVELTADSETADSRNFVLCPGGEYDRSPCGTGTSAKLACLAADRVLAEGETWKQESVTGSVFTAEYRRNGDSIIPTIRGSAFITAEGTLHFDESDPFRNGIS